VKQLLWRFWGNVCFWIGWPGIYFFVVTSRPRARVLIVYNEQVLVVKSWLGSGSWTLPGGGIALGEPPLAAAVREVNEELGIILDPAILTDLGPQRSRQAGGLPTKHHLFVVELSSLPKLVIADHEIMQHAWLDVAKLHRPKYGVTASVRDAIAAWSRL
jgi:8-oxo-dGTP pyrophosphatase MutT (NUDIX family)